MTDRQNRTIICSVLFLDIVDYSRKPVAEQIKLRECCNALLAGALQSVAPNDRVILDTGDGAAISFLGDPEDAVFMALTLRDTLADGASLAVAGLRIRFGINLGPCKLVKDLNGRPNVIGDGINVAQRIMSFADPGQVLVSRSYYEVVSRLSDEYSRLFSYEGSRTDKHVREHEVYAVGAGCWLLDRSGAANGASRSVRPAFTAAVIERFARTTAIIQADLRRRWGIATALTVVAILAVAVLVHGNRGERDMTGTDALNVVLQASPPAAGNATPPVELTQGAAVAPVDPPREKSAPPVATAKATARAPAVKTIAVAPAVIILAISPWGEVYVDGKKRGVSPPLRNILVTRGKHKIEIRNTTFPNHVEAIVAKPGSEVRIKHKFTEGN